MSRVSLETSIPTKDGTDMTFLLDPFLQFMRALGPINRSGLPGARRGDHADPRSGGTEDETACPASIAVLGEEFSPFLRYKDDNREPFCHLTPRVSPML